ncbi:hypothetical protein BDV95DRAFT_504317 [Massariosphaeria phaeospora]|uniref:Luciferase domain-containing protein n=1 Tax=Massariosphaeria phaeospora TaxID=100035 RepID=A0A7C8M8R6_9PLEO|nr:hypothetical protein BDV95DRAFT_504317 [Massariosphaeria phaeospora]
MITLTLPPLFPPIFHLLPTLLTLSLPLLSLHYIHTDYNRFLALGPGGTPSTPLGYLKIKLLSLLSLRNPLRPQSIPAHFRPQKGYLALATLPLRSGPRPVVEGIAPQRQQTQRPSPTVYAQLTAALRALTTDPRNCVVEKKSLIEKHSSGLFASTPITRVCGGEICHAHAVDGSLHMSLHPADAALVIENGWGERHPLARGGWFRRFVPKEFMLVYAPRSEAEVDVVMSMVAASVWWVSGMDVLVADEGKGRDQKMVVEDLASAKGANECWACRMHGCGKGRVGKMMSEA